MPDAPTWSPPQMSPPPAYGGPTGPNPMETHVKVIAVLDLVFGGLAALATLAILFVFGVGSAAGGAATGNSGVAALIASFGVFLALFTGVIAALDLVAGSLLLRRRRAGKGFGIASAIVSLFSFPFGTAIGIYALVILTKKETDALLVG